MSPIIVPTNANTLEARAVTSSEAASLQGKPAKTPIIAGSICGAVLVIAWIIGFAVYFRKRYNRKKQKRLAEEGKAEPPKEKVIPNASQERIIIPPDPAVLLGYGRPGEVAYQPKKSLDASSSKDHHHNHHHGHHHQHHKAHNYSEATSSGGRPSQDERAELLHHPVRGPPRRQDSQDSQDMNRI